MSEPRAAATENRAIPVEQWSDEQLAAALISSVYRWLDVGGISHGRSVYSTLLEPAQELLSGYRPPGDWSVDWPRDTELVSEARRRLHERANRERT